MALVTLYQDINFNDPSPVEITSPGEYPKITDIGFPNDKLKSIKIAPGVKVELYEHYDFKGRLIVFNGPMKLPNFRKFNDKISSIKVILQGKKDSINKFTLWIIIFFVLLIIILISGLVFLLVKRK